MPGEEAIMTGTDDTTYDLVFSLPDGGEDTVVVRPVGTTGPGGHPVYTDDSGIVRAEISDRGEARMLATGGHQAPGRPLVCRRHTPPDREAAG
ncbi:hypothetical protein ABH931_001029 [Streptacidiphilus sp. MAP12-33]|uniref:DUF6296 family protein n=1 Tax=Streptacidiphilus sp. MAP12-33 TaxID=3156266 RepID=UPI0035151F2C